MADWNSPFLRPGAPARLDSPGPIPEEYSTGYHQKNQNAMAIPKRESESITAAGHSHLRPQAAQAGLRAQVYQPLMARQSNVAQTVPHGAILPSFLAFPEEDMTDGDGQGTVDGRHQMQQTESRFLQLLPQRAETQHLHNNENRQPARFPSPLEVARLPQTQQLLQASRPQSQPHIRPRSQGQQRGNTPRPVQQTEPRPTTANSKNGKPSVKHLTCWWWSEKGECRYSEQECLYAHHRTGKVADAPRQVKPGEPPVAGKSLERALKEVASGRTQSEPEREMG
ncbi:hypothetical protein AJ79_05789, partial [Helicocarpus griseus UAMH5409]